MSVKEGAVAGASFAGVLSFAAMSVSGVFWFDEEEVVVVMRERSFDLSVIASMIFASFLSFFFLSFVPALTPPAVGCEADQIDTGAGRRYPDDQGTVGDRHATPGDKDSGTQGWTPGSGPSPAAGSTHGPWSQSPPGLERAREMLVSARANKVLARCRALGMLELPDQAFCLSEPGRSPGSGFFVVPMINPRGDRFATAMLFREEDGRVMAITVDTATNEVIDVVSPDDEMEPIKFDKRKWADCFISACGPCIAGCAFTGPLWLKCTGACCGVAAVICVYIAIHE